MLKLLLLAIMEENNGCCMDEGEDREQLADAIIAALSDPPARLHVRNEIILANGEVEISYEPKPLTKGMIVNEITTADAVRQRTEDLAMPLLPPDFTINETYEPLDADIATDLAYGKLKIVSWLDAKAGDLIHAHDNHDPKGAKVKIGELGVLRAHNDFDGDRRLSADWDQNRTCLAIDERGCPRFAFTLLRKAGV